jgi:hypothetical protein
MRRGVSSCVSSSTLGCLQTDDDHATGCSLCFRWVDSIVVRVFCLQAKAPLKTVKPSRPPSPYKNERHSEKDTFECKFFFVLFLLLPKLNIFVVIYERETSLTGSSANLSMLVKSGQIAL